MDFKVPAEFSYSFSWHHKAAGWRAQKTSKTFKILTFTTRFSSWMLRLQIIQKEL